jgi:hypothetical protein
MNDKAPGLIEHLIVFLGLAATWVTGEGGKVAVAAGLGGLTRWLATEKRRLRDGVIAVIGGFLVGQYMWPLVLHAPALISLDRIPETPDSIAMAAFVAGTMGMSGVKILTAFIEARSIKAINGGGGGNA